jgi:class 3 adenylate cyclase
MYRDSDVRDVLELVRAPALVVTPSAGGDDFAPGLSHFVAAGLRDCEEVVIPAQDQWPFGDGSQAFVDALADFLPRVLQMEAVAPVDRRLAAVLFTDLVSSTEQLGSVGDRRWHTTLDSHDDLVRRAVARNRGRVVKGTGDGALAVFDGPAAAVIAALELLRTVPRIGLSLRAGVHVGEVETRGDDVAGIAVHLASRIAGRAEPGEVLVSTTVRDLAAGSGLEFEPRGAHELKGIPKPVVLLAASRS